MRGIRAEALQRVVRLALDHPRVQELDVNPPLVPAVLLLGSRYEATDALALLTEVSDPVEEMHHVVRHAEVLPSFVPGLEVEVARLRGDLDTIASTVRHPREEAERTIARFLEQQERHGDALRDMYA